VLDDCLAIYRRHETNTTEGSGVIPKSLSERILRKVRDNSAQHQKQAELYYVIASYLRGRAAIQLTPERRNQFLSASEGIATLGDRLAARAQINGANPFGKRVQAYSRLARCGAYSSSQAWGFGRMEAAIDLIRVILPNLSRNPA
jgi:hypothetical protein